MAKRGPPPRYPWQQIQIDYVEGIAVEHGVPVLPTFQDLAGKYGCTEQAIRVKANKGNWRAERKFYSAKIAEARQTKRADTLAGEGAKFDQKAFKIADAALSLVNAKIAKGVRRSPVTEEIEVTMSAGELVALSSAAKAFQQVGRLALGDTTDKNGVEGSVAIAGGGISGLLTALRASAS